MKYIFGLLCFFSTMVNAGDYSIEITYGNSFARPGFKWDNPDRDMKGIQASYKYLFIRTLDIPLNGHYTSAGIQYRGKSKLTADFHLGYGYLQVPDGYSGSGYLTKNWQFDLRVGALYRINKQIAVGVSWDHLSNCKSICNRDILGANKGLDWIAGNIIVTLED